MPVQKKVDILLATYNGKNYIATQLDSLMKQTYTEWRAIILDDCSTDETLSILQEYKYRYSDKFYIISNKVGNGNARDSFFQLMSFSDSDYIMFCDQDDYWEPNKIEITFTAMQECENEYGNKMPILVYTDLAVVDEFLTPIHDSFLRYSNLNGYHNQLHNLLIQNTVTGCTVMINRELCNKSICRDTENIIMHDWWLGLVASEFGKIIYLNQPTVLYRQHKQNSVGAKKFYSIRYFFKRFLDMESVKKSMQDTVLQTAFFYTVFSSEFNLKSRQMIKAYSDLYSYNIIKKWWIFLKYGIFKQGGLRILGQLIFS